MKKLVNGACRGLRLTLPGYSLKKVPEKENIFHPPMEIWVISTVSRNIRQIHRFHGRGIPAGTQAIADLQDGIVA
jgi:hypothetical protein